MISDTELKKFFQCKYPKDLTHTTEVGSPSEYDLDRIEAEKLVGKRWEDIGPNLLQEFFDIASWLNPRAFHYFFPAFIKQSQIDMKKTSLLVDSLINMLADVEVGVLWPESEKIVEAKLLAEYPEIAKTVDSIDNKSISGRRHERWKLFTKQQWVLIKKWLNWINQDKRWEVDRDGLRKAIKNADEWQIKTNVMPIKKTRTNMILLVLTMLAYFSSLHLASAFYDPGAQRWLNRDPILEKGGINLFAFVLNRPIDLGDIHGLRRDPFTNASDGCPDDAHCDGISNAAGYCLGNCVPDPPPPPPNSPPPTTPTLPPPLPPLPPTPPQPPALWNCPPFYYFWNGPTGSRNFFGPPNHQLPWFILPPYRPPVSPPVWPTGLPPKFML